MTIVNEVRPWTRSNNGWIAGVSQGLGERFDFSPGAIRLLWVISVTAFGFGFLLYILFAMLMPLEGREAKTHQPKILGVCLRLSERMEVDVVPIRILSVFALLGSFGTVTLIYFLLHIFLPPEAQWRDL